MNNDMTIGLIATMAGAALIALGYAGRWWTERRRPARVRRAAPVLTPAQIQAALRVGEDHPLWATMMQLLEGQIAETIEEATDVDNQLRPAMAAYYAGAARHLGRFRAFLVEEREKAMAKAEEEE